MNSVRVLLFDSGSIDRTDLTNHLDACSGMCVTVETAESISELKARLETGNPIDVVVLGAFPNGEELTEIVNSIANSLPLVEIILVAGRTTLIPPVTGIDPGRVILLPSHQLSRLPYMLEHLQNQGRSSQSTMNDIPSIPDVAEDHNQIIAGLTADYTYVIDLDSDGDVKQRYRSESFRTLTGYTEDELSDRDLRDLINQEDIPLYWSRVSSLLQGEPRTDEFRIQTCTGRGLWVRDFAHPIMREDERYPVRIVGAVQDITNERCYEMRLALQASILEMIARGMPNLSVLSSISRFVEEQIPHSHCSIQLVDTVDNTLRPAVSGSLPTEFVDAIWAMPIIPDSGTCGSAAFFRELTISSDVSSDPRFTRYRDVLHQVGIQAATSMPVFDSTGNVIGTIGLYLQRLRPFHDNDIALLDSAAQLAGLALDVEDRDARRQVAEMHYQALVEQMPSITLMSDPDDPCNILYLSPQFDAFSANPASAILQNPDAVRNFVHPEDRKRFNEAVQHSRLTGEPLQIEFRVRRTSGDSAWLQASLVLLRDKSGVPMHWLGVMLDVTERNAALRKVVESERRYRSLFDDNLNAIIIYDYEGRVAEVNSAAVRMSGYNAEDLIGGSLLWLIAPEDRERAERSFLESRAGVSMQFSITAISKNGDHIELSVNQSPVIVDDEIVGVVSISEDVTARRMLESQLLHQAYHDALTGLPNRVDFEHRLGSAIELLGPSNELAIILMDLNNFKIINDSLGHDVGDRYLTLIAGRLSEVIGDQVMLARLGGDEFTVLLPDAPDAIAEAINIAKRIIIELERPISIDGYSLGSSVSIGIAATNYESRCERRELIRRADIALYDAKRSGRESQYRVFDEGMDEWVFERLWIEGDLRQALANGEFLIHYQPQLSLDNDRVTGVEALLRWQHPERGLLIPDRFLRVAEETGHILEIDRWVMSTACRTIADWNASNPGRHPIDLGVNISARQFWHSGFVEQVLGILEETGFDPARLCIEITESTMIQDTRQGSELVQSLRDHGVRFAIDDFGTGYSSLSYLREFPIDVLKIDREFIRTLDQDEQQLGLVRAIVAMSRALNLVVVAEGIETEEQLALIRTLECDLAQGFLVASPQPFEQVKKLLDSYAFQRA